MRSEAELTQRRPKRQARCARQRAELAKPANWQPRSRSAKRWERRRKKGKVNRALLDPSRFVVFRTQLVNRHR